MSGKIDFDALRKQTLGKGEDEAVTINTRALIDKVLARYSGEWTTLRELLQNAADASSKVVQIRLETLPSPTVPVPQSADPSTTIKHVLLHHTVKATRVENDGEPFTSKDWARLKKIAEGNPDETKIGAFGVGFYSVFADSEEPFVSSGKEALAFYWKGDALYTKSLRLPDDRSSKTTFMLPNRTQDSPVPNLLSLCRFLANSLTFVGLEQIELWLDEWKIMSLRKKNAPSFDVQISKDISRTTKEGLMQVSGVKKEAAQVDATWLKVAEWDPKTAALSSKDGALHSSKNAQPTQSLRSFFSKLAPAVSTSSVLEKQAKEEREAQLRLSEDLLGTSTSTIFVHVNRASVKTLPGASFAIELERATKKPPPKQTTISLLSASFDETEASSATERSKIFDSFVPSGGKGRIFIGFTTNQTTGLDVHISTPSVIPTVERESIDLNNRYIKTWNVELLRTAGITARIAWSGGMDAIQEKLSGFAASAGRKKISQDDVGRVVKEAAFLHRAFSWSETTPSPEVGRIMEEAFWTCNQKVPISTLSSNGVLPASKVRIEPEDISFVEGIPTLPQELTSIGLIKKLISYGIITEVTVTDIKTELEAKALTTAQLRQFLAWILHKVFINEIPENVARPLLEVAVANDDEDGTPRLIVMAEMKYFLNPAKIPAEMPLPSYVLPFKFTSGIKRPALERLFEDLQMVPWLRWLVENTGGKGQLNVDQDITKDRSFAASVLAVVSKQWDGLSQSSKNTVVDLFSSRSTIPTKLGMRKPAESYFSSVKLFDDLPTVIPIQGMKDKVLAALGVRKTIEISVIIERLMERSDSDSKIPASSQKWNHIDLIKYLTSIREEIPSADIKFIKNTKLCPIDKQGQPSKEQYLISDIYFPDDSLRKMKFPILYWSGPLRPESKEGRFLAHLGLRSQPSYSDLIDIMSNAAKNSEFSVREHALRYLIDHYQTKGYNQSDHSQVKLAYLPIEGSEKKVATPASVFVNEKASVLGFDILRRDLQVHAFKFGVKQDPPVAVCLERLLRDPPQTKRDAKAVFGYLASRLADLNAQHTESLAIAKIVPVLAKTRRQSISRSEKVGEKVSLIAPRTCFLGSGDSKYADIFDYVDFGPEANSFLLRVGSKHEPSISELAQRLVHEPATLFSILGDVRYLELLRSVAESWSVIRKDKRLIKDLHASKCLLAYKEISSKPSEKDKEEDEEFTAKSWTLAKASEIVIINDVITFSLFKEALLAAPMEESLEALYHALGAPLIGSLLQERQALGSLEKSQASAQKLQQLLHERTRLYLHDYQSSDIKHDHHWIQKHLSVQCVQSISMTFSLDGYPLRKKLPKQAVLSTDQPVLFVTKNFDMLEVSQAVAPLLLHRVKPQAIFMLEMMLESTLNRLARRGYNVQRILNEKAREAKIAEERRKQQEEEEVQRLKEREKEWEAAQAANAARASIQTPIPGGFPDSPEHRTGIDAAQQPDDRQSLTKQKSIFSNIGKRFNLDQVGRSISQSASSIRSNTRSESVPEEPPPPYSQGSQPQRSAQPSKQPTPQAEVATAPHQVQQNLMSLIQASRPHNSNNIQGETTYNDVKETSTYCDPKPGHQITYVGESQGIRVFLDNDSTAKGLTQEKFFASNASALQLFATILFDCADSFALKRNTLHMFYDDSGSTIAFNKGKALFFNYRYFDNLHLPAVQQGKRAEAVVYWSVVMAHELAHNVVPDHSSQHSFYTESLVMEYFAKIAAKAAVAVPDQPAALQDPLRPHGATSLLD